MTGNTFENNHFKIVLDPARGAIRSLIDKRSGRELVDASAEHGFGQYLHEKFSADEVASYCKAYIRGEQTPGTSTNMAGPTPRSASPTCRRLRKCPIAP